MEKKTQYKISRSVYEGIIEITITGEVTVDAIDRMQNEVITIERTLNAKAIIVDVHDLKERFGPVVGQIVPADMMKRVNDRPVRQCSGA